MDYKSIMEKVKRLDNEVSRAEGQKEQIMNELKSFGVTNLSEVDTLITKYKAEEETLRARMEAGVEKLNGLTDWSVI